MQKISLALLHINPQNVLYTQEVQKTTKTKETPRQLTLEESIHQYEHKYSCVYIT